MLHLSITNSQQHEQRDHEHGYFEFGRAPRPDKNSPERLIVRDSFVSRHQLRIEPRAGGCLWMLNLSDKRSILFQNRPEPPLEPGQERVVMLPVHIVVGETQIVIEDADSGILDEHSLSASAEPYHSATIRRLEHNSLINLGEAPKPEKLTQWLERVISLERLGADLDDFYPQAARALVELIGLDLGLVLVRRGHEWQVVAGHVTDDSISMRYSRTLVNRIHAEKRTYFQDLEALTEQAESLLAVEGLVASPIFGVDDEVAGVLYGARLHTMHGRHGVTPLQAQVVQLLASVIGANLARSTALRTRVQFEQFFSTELVQQLEQNPNLLEPCTQDVTILCSDLRGFTTLSEKLGADITCRLIQDLMEQLSQHIVESGGIIVDYAGDGILAMWNAPVTQYDHAHRACRAALAMQGEMPSFNDRWQSTVGDTLKLGIGLNTGPAQVGNTGSQRKFKYGPLGHTVNLASRVQDATKKRGDGILVTEATLTLVVDSFQTQSVGSDSLPGVAEPTPLYVLLGETETL